MIFNRILIGLGSFLFLVFIAATSAVLFCLACLIFLTTRPFDPRRVLHNLFSSFWASLYIWCMPLWSVEIRGREKMDISKSYVLVSNHQSQVDILVLYRLFFPYRWVSKAEVFNLPFIGWNMRLNGDIKLKRGDKDSIAQMMQACEDLLKQNISIFFFPEGTRSKTGLLKPFKPGAFILAKNQQKPILPIVLNHTRNALPKHSLRITGRTRMTVDVLDEVPYSEFARMSPQETADMVRDRIAAHVTEHQNPSRLEHPADLQLT